MGLLSRSLETKYRYNARMTRIEKAISALRREHNDRLLSQIQIYIPVETAKELKRRGLLE